MAGPEAWTPRQPAHSRVSFNRNELSAPTRSRLHSASPFGIGRAAGQCRSGCGRSSGVEHNLAKVGVEGSNPFARSKMWHNCNGLHYMYAEHAPPFLISEAL